MKNSGFSFWKLLNTLSIYTLWLYWCTEALAPPPFVPPPQPTPSGTRASALCWRPCGHPAPSPRSTSQVRTERYTFGLAARFPKKYRNADGCLWFSECVMYLLRFLCGRPLDPIGPRERRSEGAGSSFIHPLVSYTVSDQIKSCRYCRGQWSDEPPPPPPVRQRTRSRTRAPASSARR